MPLFIQHGHGKSDKIDRALASGSADGVIFGARNEVPDRLGAYIEQLHSQYSGELLLDPQFYVSTLVPANDRYLPEHYGYYSPGRTAADFTRAARVQEYVKHALDIQIDLGVDALISPSTIFDTFNDRWAQIALTMADTALTYHAGLSKPPPLLLTFVLSEGALTSEDDLSGFLDTVTQDGWDADGFYLIVSRDESSYCQRYGDARLANLLYLVHVLGDRNGYRVICGYSDFSGILLRVAGARAFACGWYQSLRQFHTKSFIKRRPGGQRARERYSSGPLLNSVMLSELQTIHETGLLDEVLSGVSLDDVITSADTPEASDWNTDTSEQHHWQTLKDLDSGLTGKPRADLRSLSDRVDKAAGIYTLLGSEGVSFDRNTGSDHLGEWKRSLGAFRTTAGL